MLKVITSCTIRCVEIDKEVAFAFGIMGVDKERKTTKKR